MAGGAVQPGPLGRARALAPASGPGEAPRRRGGHADHDLHRAEARLSRAPSGDAVRRRRRVGLVTCETLPEPDPDASLLAAALDRAGLEPVPVPWDADGPDTDGLDLCVFRSCWNAHERPDEFLAWIDARSRRTRFRNDPATVRWNFHKGYLLELEAAGVPIVPTRLFRRGDEAARVPGGPGWEDVVVKPAVSAASWRTHRFAGAERSAAHAFLRELLRDRDALVQPYQEGVEREGERAVVWIDGATTHAVRKSARFAGADESVSEARPVGAEERAVVRAAISWVSGRVGSPLYARADFMPDREGRPRLSELELIEPSLFLAQHPVALERFVAAVAREAAAGPRLPAARGRRA